MEICKLFIFIILLSFFSCKKEFNDGKLKIYHLKPNLIMEKNEYKINKKYYSLDRQDFFAIKNFDMTNENHKIKIDSFVIDYIKDDDFLIKNDNARWSLIFFKYSDKITENTKHEFDTDYTIHNLFAFKKRLIYYAFNTRKAYKRTGYYFNEGDSIVHEKRKIIKSVIKTKPLVRNSLKDK